MDKVKGAVWLLVGLAVVVSVAVLTAMGRMPAEVMAAIAATAVTAIFGERKYDALDKSWAEFYDAQLTQWKAHGDDIRPDMDGQG